jgi:hypothetical protein
MSHALQLLMLLLLLHCACRVDYILAHPDVLSVTAFKMGVRVTPQGVSHQHDSAATACL